MQSSNKHYLITMLPLFLVIVIDTMGFGLVMPIFGPLFVMKTGGILPADVSDAMRNLLYGVAFGSFSILMLFGAPILGDLSDYLGRKKVLIIALLATAVSWFVAAWGVLFHSIYLLILGRCFAGLAAGSQPIAQAAMADVSSHENKASNMSLMIFASCLGFVIGPVIGGYFANSHLVKWFNFSTPFFVAGLLAIFNALLVLIAFRETFVPHPHKKLQLTKGLKIFAEAFVNKKVRLLSVVLFFFEMGFAIYFVYISMFVVQQFHFSSLRVAHLMTYFGVVWAITFVWIVRSIVKHFKLNDIIFYSLLVTIVSVLTLLWPKQIVVWLSAIPLGITNGLSYTALITLLSNSVDADSQGWVMGVASSVAAAAWGVGALLAGVCGAFDVKWPFISAAVFVVISFLLFYYSSHRTEQTTVS
jgi:DHA1 family tetracycline resistance protein-like MFS transporter